MKKIAVSFIGLFALFGLTACQTDLSSNSYNEATVGRTQTVDFGTVISSEVVQIQGSNTGVGGLGGGLAGAVGGSAIGGGRRANMLGGIGGGLAGGLIGNAIEKKVSSQKGVRYLVRLDDTRDVRESNISTEQGSGSLTGAQSNNMSISRKRQQAKVISIVQGLDDKGPLAVGSRVMILDGASDRARVIPA
jgi:outer membrane lipoprotein SlyB